MSEIESVRADTPGSDIKPVEGLWFGEDGEPFCGAGRGGKRSPFVWLWKVKISPERAEKLARLLLTGVAFARGEIDDYPFSDVSVPLSVQENQT